MLYLNLPTPENPEFAITTIAAVGLILCVCGLLFGGWLYIRNNKVVIFRQKIGKLSYQLSIYFILRDKAELVKTSQNLYDQLPTYDQMILSLRPLELEEYVDLDTYAGGEIKRAMKEIDSDLSSDIYRSMKRKRDRCPRCGGTGNELASMYRPCEACTGSGIKNPDYEYEK